MWVTQDVVRLYRLIVQRMYRLRRIAPLRTVQVADEGWGWADTHDRDGVWMQVAVAEGMLAEELTSDDDFYVLIEWNRIGRL